MKKFGMTLGAAAVAVLAGCKDPDYVKGGLRSQDEVKNADTQVVPAAPAKPKAPKCTCAPGTKHKTPCSCGAADCKCVVVREEPPAPVVAPAPKPVEPETTIYIVQGGDTLSKISKRFNIKIAAIKNLNKMTKDVVRLGQKLKLPGKVDVGVQTAPTVKKAAPKKGFTPYKGVTKDYTVKNGDTLGKIAYSNGVNIRQLKELNGLKGDALRIGQKLKIPETKVTKEAAPVVAKKPDAVPEAPKEVEKVAADVDDTNTVDQVESEDALPKTDDVTDSGVQETDGAAEAAPAPATVSYTVGPDEDLAGIAIRFSLEPSEIRELNELGPTDQVKPGQMIKLPASVQL